MSPARPLHRRLAVEALEDRALLAAIFVKVPSVPGEATAKGHEREIDVLSWSWGTTQSSGGGGGAGKVSVQDFSFAKLQDSSSVRLAHAAATQKPLGKVKVQFVEDRPEAPVEYLQYELKNVYITSFQTGGSGDGRPIEHISLNFEKVTWEYKEQGTKKVKGASAETATLGPDVNGDGRADPLYFNFSLLADLDRDGILDLVVAANPNNSRTVVPDLDGDGLADITPRPGPGDNAIQVLVHRLGESPTLQTALADYDGDGRIDLIFPWDVDNDGLADLLTSLRSEQL
jgi:type VI secretion system secreted protein Hcp